GELGRGRAARAGVGPAPPRLAVRDREALCRGVPGRVEPDPRRGSRRPAVRERVRAPPGQLARGRGRLDLPRALRAWGRDRHLRRRRADPRLRLRRRRRPPAARPPPPRAPPPPPPPPHS